MKKLLLSILFVVFFVTINITFAAGDSGSEGLFKVASNNCGVNSKQAYLGIAWAVLRPLALMMIFTLVKSFVGIDSGDVPYPILTFAALMPWVFFQDATTEGIESVVKNSSLVRKIYFPREIFPLTAVTTKLVEFGISAFILAGLMVWYQMVPTVYILWVPLIILYTLLVSLNIALIGAAINVSYRDIGAALPIMLSLLMYASPVIYPLSLVRETLIVQQAAGEWSDMLYTIYTLNPLAGIIDSFQNVVLRGLPPDFGSMLPGLILTAALLPLSYRYFKWEEPYFADVI